ncbi:MAG: DEAD/DEAH box helicase family protein [Clostridiales bacterium]|nr:DEAD/DEAH box helicase family protein [Clostridiales bacterium]
MAPGLYTLTVPTGGGKTTASLAFALHHAVEQKMKRIIYVIPYTSIIDQTVDVFRGILGEETVLAHYGEAAFRQKAPEDLTPEEYRQLLASENWDAPLVVTTAVQFFESLYTNRSSRCRKLHNLADSVIIFDEAQTLPPCPTCVPVAPPLPSWWSITALPLCCVPQPSPPWGRCLRSWPRTCRCGRFALAGRPSIRPCGAATWRIWAASAWRGWPRVSGSINRRSAL